MEDSGSLSGEPPRLAFNATPRVDLILDSSGNNSSPLPVYVGHLAENSLRWSQMMAWLPGFIAQMGAQLYRVNCTRETDAVQGVIDCHVHVARAALSHYGGRDGVYLDLEDNCLPTQRAQYSYVSQATLSLLAHPEWSFIHLSRFPAPMGFVDPHTCVDTPLWEYGANIYRKMWGYCELAQAMLCHTAYARLIASPTFVFPLEYDVSFSDQMLHVVYPSVFQRRTERETATAATAFFSTGLGVVLRDVAFTPAIYTSIDFINAHASWFSVLLLPVIVIACLTGDFLISAWCFVAGFVVCWALGFR